MSNRSLVIDVVNEVPQGDLNEWKVLGNAGSFIRQIKTPELGKDADTGSLVSGIPTAFARVDLFKSAFNSKIGSETSTSTGNLYKYYDELIDEWRGFLACLALDYPNIRVRRVNLEYSDGKPIEETAKIYEPKGAFGNMLLRRRDRWCEQGRPENNKGVPFINIIRYSNRVVGATAPETLLFTSSGYKVDYDEERPWVSKTKNKFTDPLRSGLSEANLQTLYAYVGHVKKNLDEVEAYYPQELGVDYNAIRRNLERWMEEMEDYARSHTYKVNGGTIPPVSGGFAGPFGKAITHEDSILIDEGQIVDHGETEGAQKYNPRDLLLPSSAKIARIHLSSEYNRKPEKLKELPVFVLAATVKDSPDERAFFALPLSAKGILAYGKSIGALVGLASDSSDVSSRLTAVYSPEEEENNLEVELSITSSDGKTRRYAQQYTVGNDISLKNKDLLIWPNFISKQWKKYYLYSELPHNARNQGYTAVPLVGDTSNEYFRVLTDENGMPIILAEQGEIIADKNKVDARLLVGLNNAVANNIYKYEIYSSDKPFKGVSLKAPTGEDGGYLVINYTTDPTSTLPRNLLNYSRSLAPVTVGIDFGSTNTSVAYSDLDGSPKGFNFTNQRVSLLDRQLNGSKAGLQENRILFFQAPEKPLPSNNLHSVLTIHDEHRLAKNSDNESLLTRLGKEVQGGFPCFMDNLPVTNVSDDIITLRYNRIGQVEQVHNMKWSNPERDVARKKAYLRTLMLHVYAEMFAKEKVPVKLRWSYPSAMSNQLLNKYQLIWNDLADLLPVSDDKDEPMPLDVSIAQSNVRVSDKVQGGRPIFGAQNPASNVQDQPGNATISQTASSSADLTALQAQMQAIIAQQMPYNQMLSQPLPPETLAFVQTQLNSLNQQLQEVMTKIASVSTAPASPAQSAFNPAPQQTMGGFAQRPAQTQTPGGFSTRPEKTQNGFTPRGENRNDAASEEKILDIRPDDPNRVVSYNPQPLFRGNTTNNSFTEANAVANFISTSHKDRDQLTLCFDIGGSTTDISALYKLKAGITMVKQNSIRFAAQRVSGAARYTKGFEKVLTSICEKYDIKILGLNDGENRYSSDTASYYFDQIVSRLTDDQLPALYSLIMAECPGLMWVNMYVTGLLIYYAGQVAAKLIDDLGVHLNPDEALPGDRYFPEITVCFAGKGSRLLQWLAMTQPAVANDYYRELFILGYGGYDMINPNFVKIELPSLSNSSEIKYEVSKGLAKNVTELYNPADATPSEIIGETGFKCVSADNSTHDLPPTNSITPEMIEHIGTLFFPTRSTGEKFKEFCSIFDRTAQQLFRLDLPTGFFDNGTRDMNITSYVQTAPEYMRAAREKKHNNGKFDFVAPIIILEGMKFYDDYLLKALK